jgi:ABC-2 type transport system permease protein
MKVYLEFFKNSFQSSIAYRMNILLAVIGKIILLIVTVAIWQALLGNREVNTDLGTVSLREMVTYTILSISLSTLIWSATPRVGSRFRSGEISMDLIKPIKFKYYIFSDMMGGTVFRIFSYVMPIIIFGAILYGFEISSWDKILLFLVASANAIFLQFMITYLIGLINFWTMSVTVYGSFIGTLSSFFSGSFVPLWFFPKWLYDIAQLLPFKLIYYTPISIYLGKVSIFDSFSLILQQCLWILLLVGVEKIVWKRGIKRLVIQGG